MMTRMLEIGFQVAKTFQSPWNTLRRDEEMRAEIFQDIERCMPEEPFFRRSDIQQMMLDILFVFCKINQDVGYRQGMHELLAPIIWVIEQDAIDSTSSKQIADTGKDFDDSLLKEVLDFNYIEHDAFTLLSLVMRSAKSFYELGEPDRRSGTPSTNTQGGVSPIVEKSKKIHEFYLAQVDPELARHLTDIEVLPQIFLIRWIRLLFGREFPFEDLLELWDTLFAEDPELNLIDLICVAMLVRIRWQLLEANYSFALMLLLKYPSTSPPHAPRTFVDDAIYLRDNLNATGGARLNNKYSERHLALQELIPDHLSSEDQLLSSTQKHSKTRSPLSARFLQQQGGVEALFQGAAKGVFERGERLGINRAVREAVDEVKKKHAGVTGIEGKLDIQEKFKPATNRNGQLAKMLDNAMADLRAVSISTNEDKEVYLKAMDLAISRVDFVKVYLEDASIPLPMDIEQPATSKPDVVTMAPSPSSSQEHPPDPGLKISTSPSSQHSLLDSLTASIETEEHLENMTEDKLLPSDVGQIKSSHDGPEQSSQEPELPAQPKAPVPTRASIAQSSFAWMLEPNDSSNSSSPTPPFRSSAKRSNVRREKAAFLFGESEEDITKTARLPSPADADEGFNLGSIRGWKERKDEAEGEP
ncbi:hypothetical protein B7463_g624, partial [Scytalidium lignicola]